jgi:tripartite-type tricarboxylate transporter receptor subunit TctC
LDSPFVILFEHDCTDEPDDRLLVWEDPTTSVRRLTVADFLPGFEASTWFGVGVPRNTPAEIADRLNKEITAGLADAKLRARIADLGRIALPGSPADFGNLIAGETEKWAKVIRTACIKPE